MKYQVLFSLKNNERVFMNVLGQIYKIYMSVEIETP